MHFKFLSSAVVLSIARHVSAANEYSDSDLANKFLHVVQDVAPLWHFSDGSCYPQAASVNGVQTNGDAQDDCIISKLSSGCQSPGSWNGANTYGTSFPTYYTGTQCSNGEYIICYDIYFRHDSGHESDWEYQCVILKKDSGNGLWYRDSVILEQDPVHRFVSWGDLITWDAGQNIGDDSHRNGNHAKIYSAKYHHTMFPDQHTANKDSCATNVGDMYRVNDFVWAAADWLVDGREIPADWAWGKAASNPQQLASTVCSY